MAENQHAGADPHRGFPWKTDEGRQQKHPHKGGGATLLLGSSMGIRRENQPSRVNPISTGEGLSTCWPSSKKHMGSAGAGRQGSGKEHCLLTGVRQLGGCVVGHTFIVQCGSLKHCPLQGLHLAELVLQLEKCLFES